MSHSTHRSHRPPRALGAPRRRTPRAGVDPITSFEQVQALVEVLTPPPLEREEIVVLLDSQRRGIDVVIVDEIPDDDGAIVVTWCASRLLGPGGGMIIVSSRPDGELGIDDVRRLELVEFAAASEGVTVHDWLVVGRQGIELPRRLAGRADPWESSPGQVAS